MRRESLGKDLIFIGGLAVVAVALILYLVIDSNPEVAAGGPANADTPPATVVTGSTDAAADSGVAGLAAVERRQPGDPFAMGAADAPVVMVVYSDYRCPFCAKFSRDTEPILIDKYVDEGVLRIEWRDLPIFGDQSMAAARAGRAAADQAKFREFATAVFAASPDRGHPDLTPEALRGFAAAAGVADLDRFDRYAADPSVDQDIYADMLEANTIGVSSTPSFVVNGTPILGAQPVGVFEQVIEAAAGSTS